MEDLINDSDYIVKIAMIISCGNLINQGFIEVNVIRGEIFPVFIKLLEETQDNVEAQQKISRMFGKFIYEVNEVDHDTIKKYKQQICKHFQNYCNKDDVTIRRNAAYNFSCLFQIFVKFTSK